MVDGYLNIELIATIMTVVLSVGSIGALIWQLGRGINKRADIKAEQLKIQTDSIATDVKNQNLLRASEIKETTNIVLEKIKSESTEREMKLRDYLVKLADDYRQTNAKHISEVESNVGQKQTDLEGRINEVNVKMTSVLEALGKRTDMINGNIASIRTDIADLQEDLSQVIDKDESPQTSRERAKMQRLKRRRIEADRVAQSE